MMDGQSDTIGQPTLSIRTTLLTPDFGELEILDDLIRLRAADAIQHPILAYPQSEDDPASYQSYTGQDLDAMINQTTARLDSDGVQAAHGSHPIVALLTWSDLDMVVTFFALSRLGYTVMMISPRLSSSACVDLLETVGCETIIYGRTPAIRKIVGDILRQKLLKCSPIRSCSANNKAEIHPVALPRQRNPENIALILHSSGSTGSPKPLFLSHRALMTHPPRGPGLTTFSPLPWYHLHGLSTALQAMYMRKTAYMWNAALPLTAAFVISAVREAQPELVAAVPYMLQLLADHPEGIAVLKACKLVTYGGAPCPDSLGDHLILEGVHLGGSFGLTEAGLVAESISRPPGDPFWNYLKFFANLRPYVWMKPLSERLYECVYLAGHPALTTSNSDEPRGSFHSRDVFSPHPTIPGRWKYVTRLDDRITLVNGEKVWPLPLEGHINQHPWVGEAVVVGVGKALPGLLIWRAKEAPSARLPDAEYLETIWPRIEEANAQAEAFSQISRDMVSILPHAAELPRTDKGSIIRAQVYRTHAERIEALYARDVVPRGGYHLDLAETEACLLRLCRDALGIRVSAAANVYFEGVDSLKAIQLRRLILKHFRFDRHRLPSDHVVWETASISQLAQTICSLQGGQSSSARDNSASVMAEWIEKYSRFGKHLPHREVVPGSKNVLLTGATGSIGAHVLLELLNDETVTTVFCLTRRHSPLDAVLGGLAERDLHVSREQSAKIVALNGALDQWGFGLDAEEDIIGHMHDSVSLIIHAAWPVNFHLPLSCFEPHVRGLYNLIEFSLSVKRPEPAVMIFCSSVSTALRASSAKVNEEPLRLDSALLGYGQSKLVGEHMVSNARRSGAKAFSLRIGQVSGHSETGWWKESEALPLMIRSAMTLKALPELPHTCSWLPVNTLASVILEIARACSVPRRDYGADCAYDSSAVALMDDSIYNVCNPCEFSWSALLDSLQQSGYRFEIVPFEEWMNLLRESEARGEEQTNPAIKLIHHYELLYGANVSSGRLCLKRFLTGQAERDSRTLRDGRVNIVEDGILRRYAQAWLAQWAVV